jgi:NAD(P) transhydrogenase subunit alpha
VISKVPNTLHTPLMSGTNAIHGIVLLGGLLLVGLPGLDGFSKALLVIAIAFGTINIIGGFLVTDRMLEMFKAKPKPKAADGESKGAVTTGAAAAGPGAGGAGAKGPESKGPQVKGAGDGSEEGS